ncbi:hypothetical protein LMH73_020545 [Vibrio splendidus]|nr:hypothetical protein [Vibrio splendidus]MCC4880516.1 hypothetical protein [Vibrio splendidus]
MKKFLVCALGVLVSFSVTANATETKIKTKPHAHVQIADHCNFAGWKQDGDSLTIHALCGQIPHFVTISGEGVDNIENVVVTGDGTIFGHPINIYIFPSEELGIGKVNYESSKYALWGGKDNEA